jgi:hypothetical protein
MPWKCPACSTPIRRELIAAGDDTPQPARVYRCSICHLELVLSDDGTQMVVAPFTSKDEDSAGDSADRR